MSNDQPTGSPVTDLLLVGQLQPVQQLLKEVLASNLAILDVLGQVHALDTKVILQGYMEAQAKRRF